MKKTPATKKIFFTTLGVFVLCFIYHNSRDAIFGATVSVSIARDGSTVNETALPIVGFAPKVKSVTINKHPVPLDTTGHFKDSILLSPGYNIVEVSSVDTFNKTTTTEYHLVGSPPNNNVALVPEKTLTN